MPNVPHYDVTGLKKKSFDLNEKQDTFIKRFGRETFRSDSDVIRFALSKLEEIYKSSKSKNCEWKRKSE